ncbi:MAG: hypothetical protein MPK05_05560 [Gammaproteobacteria bacterium]|nr:hypothetical protein [Gammaproteobacteria bacterium]
MTTSTTKMRNQLLNDCERSARYHHARAGFYDAAHLRIQFFVFVVTAASASILFGRILSETLVGMLLLFAVSLLALFSVLWNPSGKAGHHKSLHRGFITLAGIINAAENPSKAQCEEWTRAVHALFAEEPPIYRALNAHCYNQLSIKLDVVKDGYFVDLKWYHHLLRNLVHFQGGDFPIRRQSMGKRSAAA